MISRPHPPQGPLHCPRKSYLSATITRLSGIDGEYFSPLLGENIIYDVDITPPSREMIARNSLVSVEEKFRFIPGRDRIFLNLEEGEFTAGDKVRCVVVVDDNCHPNNEKSSNVLPLKYPTLAGAKLSPPTVFSGGT